MNDVGAIKSVAKRHIPRVFIKQYIPGWHKSCTKLFEDFQKNKDCITADKLIDRLNVRKHRWSETTERLNFKHSSHKVLGLFCLF